MSQNFKPDFAYVNRELAWLDFNSRVLEQAQRLRNPPLERLRFLCITAANLDEFFMVRVGGLQMLKREGKRRPDPAGMSPSRQLKAITTKTHAMLDAQHQTMSDIKKQLEAHGLCRQSLSDISRTDAAEIRSWCQSNLLPLLTPMRLDEGDYAPLLQGLKLYLLVRMEHKGQDRFAAIPLGPKTQRHKFMPDGPRLNFLLLEDIVMANLDLWFGNADIKEAVPFRITRNADLIVREDEGEHFMQGMEKILQDRKESHVVRLEIPRQTSKKALQFLSGLFQLKEEDIYTIQGPLQLQDYFRLCDLETFEHLRYLPWVPYQSEEFNFTDPIFEQIARRDIVLFHPYESFTPMVHLLEEAAADPDVLAIKQILYRTSANSPIVVALERAALNGKYVTAVVELKARFDEERNISWARRLERAGVQVIYGVQGFKIHAKCCLVVRRENETLRRYTHWSTGNYNEKTAALYSDVGLFSAREDLGADASVLFNALCGLDAARNFHKISIAPLGLRKRLESLINSEIKLAKAGQKALFIGKMNTCTDEAMIRKMYEASCAGVDIQLNVRGACCLVPGIPGLSENIRVISIVGRYLEHARILYFHNGGNPLLFISSADCMTRNIDKRVEALVPVENKLAIKKLREILQIYWEDNEDSWKQNNQGLFELRSRTTKPVSSQKVFENIASQKYLKMTAEKGFKPLRSAIASNQADGGRKGPKAP